jgi:hypothetical protein
LTFDDGPWEDTPAVLDLLARYRIKATFCMIGRQVATHAALVRRMVAEGHTLCNHTWSHDEMLRNRPADRIRAELQQTNDAIHAVVPGAVIGYFRAPGGNFSTQVVSIAASMGMTSIFWSVDPQDWRGPGVESIITNVLTNTRPGSIVLLHDGAGPQTVAALQTILPDLAGRYTLIALPAADPRGVARSVLVSTTDPAVAGRMVWTLGYALFRSGQTEQSLEATGQALAGRTLTPLWTARVRAQHAMALNNAGRYAEAEQIARRAQAEGEQAGGTPAAPLVGTGVAAWTRSSPGRRTRCASATRPTRRTHPPIRAGGMTLPTFWHHSLAAHMPRYWWLWMGRRDDNKIANVMLPVVTVYPESDATVTVKVAGRPSCWRAGATRGLMVWGAPTSYSCSATGVGRLRAAVMMANTSSTRPSAPRPSGM